MLGGAGNLKELGGWGAPIALERSADRADVWQVELELPMGMSESHKKGLFEFRYVIEAADGSSVLVEEGGVSRRQYEMHPLFLHNFKSLIDPDNGRPTVGDRVKLAPGLTSKGSLQPGTIGEILQDDRDHLPYKIGGVGTTFSWYKETDVVLVDPRPPPVAATSRPDPHVEPSVAFRTLFRREWSVLCDGRLEPATFLRNIQGLAAGIPDRERSHAESLFDEILEEFAAASQLPPPIPSLALLGCVGIYGVSSSEREWVAGTHGGGYYRASAVPAPRPWCRAVAHDMDVRALLQVDLKERFDADGKKLVVAGLEEAVERCATDGSFDWLHIMPLLDRNGGDPDVPRCRDPDKYAEATDRIVTQAVAQIAAERAQAESAPEPEPGGAGESAGPARAGNNANTSVGLGISWLKQAIMYAPNMQALNAALHHPCIKGYLDQLGSAVAQKVGLYNFPTAKEVTAVAHIVAQNPDLQDAGMTIAALLLANKEIDVFTKDTLDVVQSVAKHANAGGESDASAQLQKTRELSLLDAAKGWLKRLHGAAEKTTGVTTIVWTKTEKELQEERTAAMNAVMADVDGLLRTAVLQPHARSLVFEMTRCHMFKGTPSNVLAGLCTAAGQRGGFGLASSQFEQLAAEKATGLVKELVSQVLDRPTSLNESLNMIINTLPPHSVLQDKLIDTFACTMSFPTKDKPEDPPALGSILERSQQWAKIIRNAAQTSGDTAVKRRIDAVKRIMSDTVSSILDETITLRKMHAVLDASTDYMMLADLLSLGSVSHALLAERRTALHDFSTQLQHISVYGNFFCSCGVPINAEDLVKLVGGVAANYDTLAFSATHGVFDEIEVAADARWLFHLQASELFLATWRECGTQVCDKIRADSRRKATAFDRPDLLVELFADRVRLDKEAAEAEPEPEAEPEAEPADQLTQVLDDGEFRELHEELLELQGQLDQMDDDEPEREEIMAEIAEVRAAIDERRLYLAGMRRPRVQIQRRTQQIRGSDLRVGVRVIALSGIADVQAFTSGEVAEVIEIEGSDQPSLLIQWDALGKTSTVSAGEVNRSFTALNMRDRLMTALKLIHDLSHSEFELSQESLSSTLAEVLSGKRVDPTLQADIDGAQITVQDVEIVLTQADVKSILLPAVKTQWSRFYGAVVAQELSTTDLHSRFHSMGSESQRDSEIRLLAATGHGCVDEAGAKDPWVDVVLGKISAFMLCESCQQWIPGIARVRDLTADLFDTAADDDESLKRLHAFMQSMEECWSTEHLSTVSAIFEPIKDTCAWSQVTRMEFFAALAQTDTLVTWLLEHADTDAFNSLLQVCRPRTEDPLLLKAIASLVHVRTVMLDLLYIDPPYISLAHMLERVGRIDMARGTSLQHLLNVQQSFDGLLELFEKETRSPGISSCYELDEIRREGMFVLTATEDAEKILTLRLQVQGGGIRYENLEYVQDLRSKLMMTEIPDEILVDIPDLRELIDGFSEFLQIISDMKLVLLQLVRCGHFSYQSGFSQEHSYTLQGAADLRSSLAALEKDLCEWDVHMDRARSENFFLNYYSARETLKLVVLLKSATAARFGAASRDDIDAAMTTIGRVEPTAALGNRGDDAGEVADAEAAQAGFSDQTSEQEGTPPDYGEVASFAAVTGQSEETAVLWVSRFQSSEQAINQFFALEGVLPPSPTTSSDFSVAASNAAATTRHIGIDEEEQTQVATFVNDFQSMMYAISSSVDLDETIEAMQAWARTEDAERRSSKAAAKEEIDTAAEESPRPFEFQQVRQEDVLEQLASDNPSELLAGVGRLLGGLSAANSAVCRAIDRPSDSVENRSDMVGVVMRSDDDDRSLPIWVTCASSPVHVIDCVLSVYVRRGRLPEPGEILFCTADTNLEEIELLFRRFLGGKSNGRADAIFCLADIHTLSYTTQVAVVNVLQAKISEHGTANAADLLIVSGRPRQVVLNSLSSHALDCPPLPPSELQRACTQASASHGAAQAVRSSQNGQGKSTWIMKTVAEQQRLDNVRYRRVPVHEATTVGAMIRALGDMAQDARNAVHLDVGHIIPASANTMLFELLVVGFIRDPRTSRVYNRRPKDTYFLEVPNSIGDKTATALRFSSFLPEERVECSADTLSLFRPQFASADGTQLELVEDHELVFVSKMLRATKAEVFVFGSPTYNLSYQPQGSLSEEQENKIMEFCAFTGTEPPQAQAWLERYGWEVMVALNVMMDGDHEPPTAAAADTDITLPECFELLREYTVGQAEDAELSSFTTLSNFVQFMYPSFKSLTEWPLINEAVNQDFTNHQFKDSFVKMLIATAKDFSTRSVPAGDQRCTDNGDEDDGAPMQRTPSGNDVLARSNSDGGLRRQNSLQNAHRFDSMISWEQSDHPVAVWKLHFGGVGVDGVDILSMNPAFVAQHLNDNLRHILRGHGLEFDRDWKKLTNEQAIDLLCHAMGRSRDARPRLQSGYVITVDNLLKMLSIALRMRCGLPVIVMGETGCGKSSLMRATSTILGFKLHTLNIHGGLEDADIVEFVDDVLADVASSPTVNDYGEVQQHILFFDEVNTCNSMALFKEIVCDGTMQGRRLPAAVKVIAACNPYRLRSGGALHEMDDRVGLVFQHDDGLNDVENVGTGIKDPLSELVYRVHPLPESMVDHLFDFGALSEDTERLYIKAMIKKALADYIDEEAMVEEISNDDQIAAQAQRMGIEFTDEMTQEDRQHIIRQRMREMLDAEAQRRAEQGEDAAELMNEMGQQQRAGGGLANKALSRFGEFVETFTELVCTAQEFVRSYYGGERSSASLRDVARCISVYRWFGEHFSTAPASGSKPDWTMADFFSVNAKAREHVRAAVIMSLAYCYHSRLPREQRMLLRHALADAWMAMQVPARTTAYGWYIAGKEFCTWLTLTAEGIADTIDTVQRSFVDRMKFPSGIALNEALCENVFMILVSTLNQIPIFVVGKPGTSKSLAMELVQTNLQGKASGNDFLRSLPAVQTFGYQCSPLSTSAGIQQAFESARRYKMEAPNTVVVVLLDEVGLAEQSPHLPLKVLHKTLDEAGSNESVVGISNWSLDPAKMNRAVHLYRPAPTVEDLALTAEGMVEKTVVKGYLQAVAKAFSDVYQHQKLRDFFGMREFYSTVKSINASLGESSTLDGDVVMNAVLRNYGGRPDEIESVITSFFSYLSMSPQGIPRPPVMELAAQNIAASQQARHLMLLTRNNAALSLMFDHNVLDHSSSVVMFGSDFPDDNTDLQVCLNIQRVKHCMGRGTTLVLVHCEALYESMYDLLNQHYTNVGGQLWVRLAFGTHSRLCPIAPEFRVIVIVEKIDAYTRLAPPLLNRFEKQVMERRDMMSAKHVVLADRLKSFIKAFSAQNISLTKEGRASLVDCKRTLCGFHSDMVPSLVLSVLQEAEEGSDWYGVHDADSELDWDRVYAEAVSRLILVASPEAACAVLQDERKQKFLVDVHQVDVPRIYFQEQAHSDLPSFAQNQRSKRRSGRPQLQQIMTFSPLFLGAAAALESHGTWDHISLCVLHDLSSERDLQDHIDAFFQNAKEGSLLLIQCDPRAASFRRIEHARYMCEAGMDAFVRTKGDEFFVSEQPEPEPEPEPELEPEPEPEQQPEISKNGAEAAEGKRGSDSKDGGKNVNAEEKGTAVRVRKGVDVVLLCHLPRETDLPFSVDFGPRWSYSFVDSIMPASTRGLLGVEAMMQHKMGEMLEMVDLGTVLSANFRYAISRLVYLYQRSNEDVRKQVGDTLSCLQNDAFVSIVRTCMATMIESNGLELDLLALSERNAASANGTFMEVLHRQFTDALGAMFAVVLSHMDRNGGLPLFLNTSVRRLWTHLFVRSFKDQYIQHKDTMSMADLQFRLEVPTDGKNKAAFACRFPFSFYLHRLLEGLRESVTTVAATNDSNSEEIAISQFKLLSVGFGIDEELEDNLLNDYIHDFACMQLMNTTSASKSQQTVMLRRILELYRPDRKLCTLAGVHGRAWDCAKRINLHLQLLDALTGDAAVAAVAAVLKLLELSADDFMQHTEMPLDAAVDIRILQCVLDHLDPSSEAQSWASTDDYGAWLVQVDSAKPAVLSVLASISHSVGPTAPSAQQRCRLCWEKYTLVRSLVLDIFVPLGVEPDVSKTVATVLLVNELRSPTALHRLVQFLCVEVQVAPQNIAVLKRGSAAVMELYIFDVACSPDNRLTDSSLALDLLRLVACEDVGGITGVSEQYSLLLPSEAGRVALLGELLHIDESELQRSVLSRLKACADAAVSASQVLDTHLCQTWLTVVEQDLTSAGLSAASLVDLIDLQYLRAESPPVSELIHTVAAIRALLLKYAGVITRVVDPSEDTAVAAEHKEEMASLKKLVDPILASASGVRGCLRSMRLHLLKTLERSRGVAFVRSCLQQHPLEDSDWLQEWIAENESGLLRFRGQNKLPQHNPLSTEPFFAEASRAVSAFLSSGSLEPIEALVSEHATAESSLKSALCTVLFHEVGLLEVLPDALSGETHDRVHALREWLAASPTLDDMCCPAERKLLQFCAGGLTTGLSTVGEQLQLNLASTPEKIATTRLLVHLAARVMASQPGDQFSFLRTLLLEPAAAKASYWPAMADDPLFMVQRALMEAGAERGAKRWFTCPNGHPFAIGQCGGAMQRSTCPECGEEIGGEDHNLTVRLTSTCSLPTHFLIQI